MTGEQLYQLRLTKYPLGAKGLEQVLAREDEYREMFEGILADGGLDAEEIEHSYRGWRACCGGRQELLDLLQAAAADVAAAADGCGAGIPPFHTGLWPAWDFNASSTRSSQGNVVYVVSGLIVALRYITQHVAACLPEIFTDQWGPLSQRAADDISDLLAKHLRREDIQAGTRVLALAGPPEQIRRDLMLGALRYVIAHEAGHLARCRPWQGGWSDDNQKFQTPVADPYELPPHGSEIQVVRATNSESIADLIATEVLRRPPCSPSGGFDPSLLFGAMCVPLLQSAVWWRRAALTNQPLGWSHPFPDMRLHSLLYGLSASAEELAAVGAKEAGSLPGEPTQLRTLGERFDAWAQTAFGMNECRKMMDIATFADRGVDPVSLMYIYLTYGIPPGVHPSDVLMAAQPLLEPTPATPG